MWYCGACMAMKSPVDQYMMINVRLLFVSVLLRNLIVVFGILSGGLQVFSLLFDKVCLLDASFCTFDDFR